MGLEVGDGVAFLKQSGITQRSSASLVEGNPPTVFDSFSERVCVCHLHGAAA